MAARAPAMRASTGRSPKRCSVVARVIPEVFKRVAPLTWPATARPCAATEGHILQRLVASHGPAVAARANAQGERMGQGRGHADGVRLATRSGSNPAARGADTSIQRKIINRTARTRAIGQCYDTI